MRHTTRLAVEPLETKVLLSGLTAMGSDLARSIATDRTSYRVGQPVVITLTETNVSDHDVTTYHGPGSDGFIASWGGLAVWRSNPGPQPLFVAVEILHPNQSSTLHATWNGRSNLGSPGDPSRAGPPVQGIFVIRNQRAPDGPAATVTIGGTQITPPRPPGRIR